MKVTISAAMLVLSLAAAAPVLAAPTLSGCPVFPRDNVWNAKVDTLPVHPRSAAWVANVRAGGDGATRPFHMDFGSGLYPDLADDPDTAAPIGIPWVTVPGSQPKISVTFTDYGDESDSAVGVPAVESPPGTFKGNYPIPSGAPIEGEGPQTPANAGGDRHVLVIDTTNCILYETGNNYRPGVLAPGWAASGGAIWDLRSNAMRPSTWTSADAAGLPIFPGLARYEEVAAGVIEHALRFTADRTQGTFIWPARHEASSITNPDVAPMGARFRLKASKNIAGFSPQARVIAQAMKTYGIILADNGSSWYVSGAPHPSWDNDVLHELDALRGSDFEAVDTSSLIVNPNTMQVPPTTVVLTAAKTGNGAGTVTSSVGGLSCGATCTADVNIGEPVTLTAAASPGSVFTGWITGGCSGAGTCTISPAADATVTATFETLLAAPQLRVVGGTIDFGGQSVKTTSLPREVWLINVGTGTVFVGLAKFPDIVPDYSLTGDCSTLVTGVPCVLTARFTPRSTGTITSPLGISSSAGIFGYQVTGVGELSLVTHFYQSILNREPDTAGKAFWQGEAARLSGLGANINETWFVMSGYFFNSPEYLAAAKSDAAFVTDLYNTFFNRAPDVSGHAYWTGQIASGLPREVVLFSFMFSPEFVTFTRGIFGNTAARPEVDMVMDFFRGVLNRLPDSSSFGYWLGRLRAAQCANPGAVYTEVDAISNFFIFSAEYGARARNDTQFVTDMYYSFLRRGGDVGGVNFWINQLATGQRGRDGVRSSFIASPEFGARVNAVIAAGCAT